MSFDDLHTPNGPGQPNVDVELNVSIVEEGEEIPIDDSELLARLESADTMASGVEARLNEILGTLNDLLTILEQKDDDDPQEAARLHSESQSERPPSEQS